MGRNEIYGVKACMGETVLYAASTFGHIVSFHLPYLQALADKGYRLIVAAAGSPPQGIPAGIRCVDLPFTKSMTSVDNLRVARSVSRLIREEGVRHVLVHTSLAAFFVRLGVRMSGCRPRVVNTVHGYLFDDATSAAKRTVLLAAEKMVASVTDAIVVMNQQDEEIARKNHLCKGGVVKVPGMGVVPQSLHISTPAERRTARERLGLPPEAFVLLYAAEFSARKNQAELIRALVQMPSDVMLALPGDGDLLGGCRKLAGDSGVAGRVVMPGRVENLADWRAVADVCVSSSRSEGLPFHAIEAMGCGLPLVLSDVKGHEDLVGDGRCGLLYPYGDEAALAACVAKLRDDEDLRMEMGRAAAQIAGAYMLPVVRPQVLAAWRL